MKKEDKTIAHLHQEVLKADEVLNKALSDLSKRASTLYGSEVIAEICDGFEVEFRRENDAMHQVITLEELIELEKYGNKTTL